MDLQSKLLIERRARILFQLSEDILLHHDDTDEVSGNSFRYSFLVLRRPKLYLQAFKDGALSIDLGLLREACWFFRDHLPGPAQLLECEEKIVIDHNLEVDQWLRQNRNILPLSRQNNGSYA